MEAREQFAPSFRPNSALNYRFFEGLDLRTLVAVD